MPHLALYVEILEVKPNPMFSEAQTALTRFLRYSAAVPCGECNKRSKHHWTQLCSFKALTMDGTSFSMEAQAKTAKVLAPLTPVCRKHLLAAEVVA